MKRENFAKNLREIMEFLDMNQTELAERLGITQAAVSQLLNAEREPSLATILKILEALPVKFERLFK